MYLQVPACVKILSYDHWNPPPSYRKLHGDLLYLQITTLEDKKYHATACTKGFFINQYVLYLFLWKRKCHHFVAFKQMYPADVNAEIYFVFNRTTEEEFNPKPNPNFKACHHSLVDLLSMISPAFKRNWSNVVKKRWVVPHKRSINHIVTWCII